MSDQMETCKKCSACETSKHLEMFPLRAVGKIGRNSRCRDCLSRIRAERNNKSWTGRRIHHRPPQEKKRIRRGTYLKSKYGVTIEQYELMLIDARGVCQICGQDEVGHKGRALSVDHCHRTGVVRGLLCSMCNTAIGKFKDDPELMEKAAAYVRRTAQQTSLAESLP